MRYGFVALLMLSLVITGCGNPRFRDHIMPGWEPQVCCALRPDRLQEGRLVEEKTEAETQEQPIQAE